MPLLSYPWPPYLERRPERLHNFFVVNNREYKTYQLHPLDRLFIYGNVVNKSQDSKYDKTILHGYAIEYWKSISILAEKQDNDENIKLYIMNHAYKKALIELSEIARKQDKIKMEIYQAIMGGREKKLINIKEECCNIDVIKKINNLIILQKHCFENSNWREFENIEKTIRNLENEVPSLQLIKIPGKDELMKLMNIMISLQPELLEQEKYEEFDTIEKAIKRLTEIMFSLEEICEEGGEEDGINQVVSLIETLTQAIERKDWEKFNSTVVDIDKILKDARNINISPPLPS